MGRRADQAAIALRLRTDGGGGEGLTLAAIAREMGISVSYASSLLTDPTGEKDRQRKRRYLNRCQHPGCKNLSWGKLCSDHSPTGGRPKWTQEMVIEAIQEWEIEHGRPPVITDWKQRAGLPAWCPAYRTVYRLFGKNGWNKAIAAAGFTPRPAHFPDWVVQEQSAEYHPMSDEARRQMSEERAAAYAANPDDPLYSGLKIGHDRARKMAARRRARHGR